MHAVEIVNIIAFVIIIILVVLNGLIYKKGSMTWTEWGILIASLIGGGVTFFGLASTYKPT